MKTLDLIVGGSLLLAPAIANAGNVSGVVRDLVTRNGFSNAEVKIDNIADTTDVNGNFSLISVPNGYKTLIIKPLDNSHLFVSQDSVNVNGNITFNATLPETTFLNNDGSRARVKANELKDVHGIRGIGKNPYLWNTQTSKDVPVTIRRFNTSDSTAIWNALMWLNDKDSTYVKFVPGTDTTQGIFIRPGSGNWTQTFTSGGYIYWNIVELTTTAQWVVAHETGYHGRSFPSPHVTTYSPSNYTDPTVVMPQPKDMAYMHIAYLLQRARQDSINNVWMKSFADSIISGVEIEPKIVVPFQNKDLILNLNPNPARNYVNLEYSLENKICTPTKLSLYNALGQLVKTEKYIDEPGKNTHKLTTDNLPSGIYFAKVNVGDEEVHRQFLVVR